jgi:hypothetical protein
MAHPDLDAENFEVWISVADGGARSVLCGKRFVWNPSHLGGPQSGPPRISGSGLIFSLKLRKPTYMYPNILFMQRTRKQGFGPADEIRRPWKGSALEHKAPE